MPAPLEKPTARLAPPLDEPRPWVCLRVEPQADNRAVAEIEALGVPAWSIPKTVMIRHARKRSIELRPLWPGYVFAAPTEAFGVWEVANRCRSVGAFLRASNGRPGTIPDMAIRRLSARVASGEFDYTGTTAALHSPGDRGTISVGQLVDIPAVIAEILPGGGLRCEVVIFNTSHAVDIAAGAFKAVG